MEQSAYIAGNSNIGANDSLGSLAIGTGRVNKVITEQAVAIQMPEAKYGQYVRVAKVDTQSIQSTSIGRAVAPLLDNSRELSNAVSERIRERQRVLAAVYQDGRALEFASAELRGDKEIVLAAVQGYGGALFSQVLGCKAIGK